MSKSRRIARIGRDCVACGCCVRVCPREAIQIAHGIIARVDREKCVGCGKCAKTCPADVIEMRDRGDLM